MWEQSDTFEASMYLKHTFECTSAPISLLCITLMFFCVWWNLQVLWETLEQAPFLLWACRAGTKLYVRKSRCGLLGLCCSAARMWLAVSSPSCTSALHSVHPGMTGIPVWREPAWRHIYKSHKCPGRDTGIQTPADWPHAVSWWLAVTLREAYTSPPHVDLFFF